MDEEGRFSLNQLIETTGLRERTVLGAVRQHQYQDRRHGALRYSLEPSEDGMDMIIRCWAFSLSR